MSETVQDRVDLVTAAAHFGVSIDTIRKRVQRGQLPAEKIGGRWTVVLDRPPESSRTVSDNTQDGPGPSETPAAGVLDNDLLTLVAKLHRENIELAGRVGYLIGQNEELRGRIALLEAPKTADPPPETVLRLRQTTPLIRAIRGQCGHCGGRSGVEMGDRRCTACPNICTIRVRGDKSVYYHRGWLIRE